MSTTVTLRSGKNILTRTDHETFSRWCIGDKTVQEVHISPRGNWTRGGIITTRSDAMEAAERETIRQYDYSIISNHTTNGQE
jgi:hypothetical protein